MEYELDFTVTKDLIRTATRRFWLQFVGWSSVIRWLAASVAISVGGIFFRQTWLYGLMAFFIVSLPLIWIMGYSTFLRRAFRRYDRMQSKQITYRFTEQGIGTKSDLGSAEVPWRMLDKIQRYPDVWLLFFGQRDYVYLPAVEITEPLKSYLELQAGQRAKPQKA